MGYVFLKIVYINGNTYPECLDGDPETIGQVKERKKETVKSVGKKKKRKKKSTFERLVKYLVSIDNDIRVRTCFAAEKFLWECLLGLRDLRSIP
jgi:hypothetical protein